MDAQITKRARIMMTNSTKANRAQLTQSVEENHDKLLTGIRVLIWRMGIAGSENEANDLSFELLQETIVTAFKIAERFDSEKSAHAWLMGIAVNKIKELRAKETRRNKHAMSVTETFQLTKNNFRFSGTRSSHQDEITEEGMIDFLAAQNSDSNTMQSRIHLTFDELVSLVDSDDKRILKYAFIDNMKGEDLAAALRVSIGAANVRLSRAISRLRKAYLSSESSERNE